MSIALLWLSAGRSAAASEVLIEWSAPPECPSRTDVAARVKRVLGDAMTSSLYATANVTQSAGKYRATLHVASVAGYGERVLEHERCEILADSVALVIALSAPRPASVGATTAHADALAIALSAHATFLAGPLPRVAFGAGGAIAFEAGSTLRLELSGSYYVTQTSTFDQTDVGARFSMLRIGASGCRIWSVGVFDFAPCLGAQAYRIEGAGFGGMVYRSGAAIVWGPALGVLARVQLASRLAVIITADSFVAVARQRFVYSDIGPLHRPSTVGLQLFVAPEVRF